MRILFVGSGTSVSIKDVERGYREALEAVAAAEPGRLELRYYDLEQRTNVAGAWLTFAWRHALRRDPSIPKPTDGRLLYEGSVGILDKALRYEVDWVLIVSGLFVHPDVVGLLARAGVRVALLGTESPYADSYALALLPMLAGAWTNDRDSLPLWRCVNRNVEYLGPAYRAGLHRADLPPDPDVPAHDVLFVGTAFAERIGFLGDLDRLGAFDGLDVGFYGFWAYLGSRSRLRRFVRDGVVPNPRTVALYRRAKVGLNLYRTFNSHGPCGLQEWPGASLNPRAVELAAVGAFSLSGPPRAEVAETFGGLVPEFTTPREAADLIAYWVEHDAERQAAAAQLPGRVAGWTFDDRVRQVLADLERWGAPEPVRVNQPVASGVAR